MSDYEYLSVPRRRLVSDKKGHYNELDVAKLNELGKDSWELVLVDSGLCIFKRAIIYRTEV